MCHYVSVSFGTIFAKNMLCMPWQTKQMHNEPVKHPYSRLEFVAKTVGWERTAGQLRVICFLSVDKLTIAAYARFLLEFAPNYSWFSGRTVLDFCRSGISERLGDGQARKPTAAAVSGSVVSGSFRQAFGCELTLVPAQHWGPEICIKQGLNIPTFWSLIWLSSRRKSWRSRPEWKGPRWPLPSRRKATAVFEDSCSFKDVHSMYMMIIWCKFRPTQSVWPRLLMASSMCRWCVKWPSVATTF